MNVRKALLVKPLKELSLIITYLRHSTRCTWHALPPLSAWREGGGRGGKNFRKAFAGGLEILEHSILRVWNTLVFLADFL